MSVPGDEARQLEREALSSGQDSCDFTYVANVLQNLIDERDEARTALGQAIADATKLKARAETAEARIRKLAEALEAHDTHVGMGRGARVEAIRSGRLEAFEVQAEAKLAELVRRVREVNAANCELSAFEELAAEYEP